MPTSVTSFALLMDLQAYCLLSALSVARYTVPNAPFPRTCIAIAMDVPMLKIWAL